MLYSIATAEQLLAFCQQKQTAHLPELDPSYLDDEDLCADLLLTTPAILLGYQLSHPAAAPKKFFLPSDLHKAFLALTKKPASLTDREKDKQLVLKPTVEKLDPLAFLDCLNKEVRLHRLKALLAD